MFHVYVDFCKSISTQWLLLLFECFINIPLIFYYRNTDLLYKIEVYICTIFQHYGMWCQPTMIYIKPGQLQHIWCRPNNLVQAVNWSGDITVLQLDCVLPTKYIEPGYATELQFHYYFCDSFNSILKTEAKVLAPKLSIITYNGIW